MSPDHPYLMHGCDMHIDYRANRAEVERMRGIVRATLQDCASMSSEHYSLVRLADERYQEILHMRHDIAMRDGALRCADNYLRHIQAGGDPAPCLRAWPMVYPLTPAEPERVGQLELGL